MFDWVCCKYSHTNLVPLVSNKVLGLDCQHGTIPNHRIWRQSGIFRYDFFYVEDDIRMRTWNNSSRLWLQVDHHSHLKALPKQYCLYFIGKRCALLEKN